MPNEYTLSELVKLSGVTPRTVRFYITEGLLPGPLKAGGGARYSDVHLDRLRLIKRLQAAHLPLSEVRRRMEILPADQLAEATAAVVGDEPSDSALDYIRGILGGKPAAAPLPNQPPPPASPPSSPEPVPSEPERAHWERISLDPDIEIHIRRPLSRQQNKRVERLISIARQLLEED